MTAECGNWQEEFVDVNFVDQRLKTRFSKIMDAFAASPGKSTWTATVSRILHLLGLETEKRFREWDTIAVRSKEECWYIHVSQ